MIDTIFWLLALLVIALLAVAGYFAYATRRIAARAERTVPMAGKFAELGGASIHYVEAGKGRPILFVHGLGGQLHHFRGTLFDRLAGDFRLIAVDRPGSGYSVRGRSAADPKAQADLLAGLIDRLKLDRPLVVGHSLGGAISLRLALDHPEKISGLALIAPLTHHRDAAPAEFGGLWIPSPLRRRILAHTLAVPMAMRTAPQVLAFVFGPQSAPSDYLVAGGGMLGLRPSHFFATSTDLMAIGRTLAEQETRYGELKVPVGVFYGTADRVLDYRQNGLAMRDKVRGLDLELADGIGHMPQFVVADRVEAFIRRIAARALAA